MSRVTRGEDLPPPPVSVVEEIRGLGQALDAEIPARAATNLLVATWNLRAFGGLTGKWQASSGDSPKRDWHALACLAEIVSRFHVIALQEVRRDTTALRMLMGLLGPDWRMIASDVTEGDPGNDERLVYVYDTQRAQPSGLVGEIVIPAEATGPVQQFARTPYAASFSAGATKFTLTTVHVLWGKKPADRLPEITRFAEWMRDWADRPSDFNENLLVLGDFNLDRIGDPLFNAFVSTGLFPPAELDKVKRTVFDDDGSNNFYDQIAWFSTAEGESLLRSMTYTRRGGGFDFVPHTFTDLTVAEMSWRISDHYPLWVEFEIPPQ